MTGNDLHATMDAIAEHCTTVALEIRAEQAVIPVVVVVSADGEKHLAGLVDSTSVHDRVASIKKLLRAFDGVAFVLCSDAWAREFDDQPCEACQGAAGGCETCRWTGLHVRRRKECIMTIARAKDGYVHSQQTLYTVDATGQVTRGERTVLHGGMDGYASVFHEGAEVSGPATVQ